MPDIKPAEFDIKRFWGVLQKRRYIAISVALLVISVCTWGGFLWPKTYEASSTVFIQRSSLIDPLIKGVGVPGDIDNSVRNLKNSITARDLIEKVMKKLDLYVRLKNTGQYESAIKSIRKNLDVKTPRTGGHTDLFTISYKGRDPKTVRDLVNTLVGQYIEESLNFRRNDASEAYDFIKKQLDEYRAKLDRSDEALKEFREKNPGMVPQTETTLVQRIQGLQTSQMEAELKLKEQMRKKDSLQKQLSGEKELTVAFVSSDDSPGARLANLNHRLILLMGKYTEKYPEVIRVKNEIDELKSQMAHGKASQAQAAGSVTSAMNPVFQQLREDIGKTDAEIESLKARVDELGRQEHQAEALLDRMPREQLEWSKLDRDRNVIQKVYDDLLKKLETAKVSKDLEMTDKNTSFRVVDLAILPRWPVRPNMIKLILVGIILGIAAGVGSAMGLDHLDSSFKDERSIENELKIPVFASVPSIITDEDILKTKKLDRKVFFAAGAYLLFIGLVLVREILSRYLGIRIL